MKREIPKDSEGRRLCEHCMETPVPASLGTKPKRYCSRNCRQRAYEARKNGATIRAAVAFAVDLDRQTRTPRTSRDVPSARGGTSRDDAQAAEPLPPAEAAQEEKPQAAAPATSRDVAEAEKQPRALRPTRGQQQQILFPPGKLPPKRS